MKVGDLLIDSHSQDLGLLIGIDHKTPPMSHRNRPRPYLVMDVDGKSHWYERDYIEKDCEVISESR